MFAILLVALSCAGIAAVLALAYCQIERERDRRAAPPRTAAPPPGRCALCDAPLPRRTTTAEVLYEVEHQIDSELQDIGRVLRTEPDALARLYRA